ncbi:response regulator receiver modulated diguanylate cyclase/phosphodiesterase with PAS sensor(s) [Pseudogulbenkiania sp. NH8B]|uniref:EAL domain-containing protein n=1 Tax=Pseudogulbenkiania sp. (strain NH8B) TaxID=748280 RepID=UPI000227A198|nr:EAL domain-containing protein [Pseudogulbenkiania sp. NH8B]BAK77972.1 response regulator receiver modulated diguanylate cyclase/phosphodiesterase with PAS sensor(s) [Pseudogulbenkiania sp. NH8B]
MLQGTDILIVEDSATQALQLQALLEGHGCRVRVARDGYQALREVAGQPPTIMISDIMMPGMDGYELCSQLKADPATAMIPIILVTTLSDPRDVMRGLSCGADNFILKPYDEKYLLSRIHYFLANQALRQPERAAVGMAVMLEGERHFITSARQQILDLLISTYEQSIQLNQDLQAKHAELSRSHALLDGLFRFSAAMSAAQTEHDVIGRALEEVLAFPDGAAAWLLLADTQALAEPMQLAGWNGRLDEPALRRAIADGCPCLYAGRQEELRQAFNIAQCPALCGAGEGHWHACSPLLLGDEVIGVLNVLRAGCVPWDEPALDAFTMIGRQLAVALARARMFESLESLVAERTRALSSEMGERARAEAALRQSEALLHKVLETLPVGVWVTDEKGGILLHNSEGERIWGANPGSEPQRRWYGPQGQQIAADDGELLRTIRHDGTVHNPVRQILSFDGAARTVLDAEVPLTDDDDQVRGGILVEQDITAQQVIDLELRVRQRAIEASVNAVLITDNRRPDNPIIYVNPAFERITGYARAAVIGRNCRFLQGRDTAQPELTAIRRALENRHEGKALLRNYRKDGSMFWNELRVAPVRDSQGEVSHYIGVLNDVTEAKRYQEELERQANFDTLTGLPNRNLLQDRLGQGIAVARSKDERFAVALLDLDNFKYVNDSLGHTLGDALLIEVARRIESSVPALATVSRLGGDDFVLLLPGVKTAEQLDLALKKVTDQLNQPVELSGTELFLSASIGCCFYPDDGSSVDELLSNADTAMYQAKALGKSQVRCFALHMNDRVQRRVELEGALRRAIAQDELTMYYQPQLDLQSGRLCGFEALLRWRRGERLISPLEFIPIAEETGLIREIDRYVIRAVFLQVEEWRAEGLDPGEVAINISALSLQEAGIVPYIAAEMASRRLPPDAIKLEVTESLLMKNVDTAQQVMSELKALHLKWSIDDFGTGYSALSYLRRYPFDQLKIDKSFIDDVNVNPENASVTRAIISMARSLRIAVIAEGVENREQLGFLVEAGCDQIQGYYYSPPLTAEACRPWLIHRGPPGPDQASANPARRHADNDTPTG